MFCQRKLDWKKRLKRVKLLMFPGVLVGVLAVLLMGTTGIHAAASSTRAASASSCGSWSIVKSPSVGPTSTFNAVAAVSTKDVWAVGYSSGYNALIEHWNGTSWQVVASNAKKGTILRGITVISANDIWAVGDGPGNYNGIGAALHWNGTQWSVVHTPNPAAGSVLYSVSAVSSNNVWATGSVSYTSNGAEYDTLVEHWNGTSWKVVQSPNVGTGNSLLNGVSAVPGTSQVWAVGVYGPDFTKYKTFTEYYC